MVLVDTSVWIEFFKDKPKFVKKLTNLIKEENQVCFCGIVLQEVLQGIKDKKNYNLAKNILLKFPFLGTNKKTYLLAAEIYRDLRKRGVTVPSIDTTIAAIALENNLPIFTTDKHFSLIAKHTKLILY